MEDKCPCEAVEKLQEVVDEHEKRLADGSVEFAVISTKLNIIMAVLGAIGVAVCGAIIALLFHV